MNALNTIKTIGAIAVLVAFAAYLGTQDTKHATATPLDNVSGYLWSDMPDASDHANSAGAANVSGGRGLGWISMNNTNDGSSVPYGVNLDPATGDLSGSAWSEYGGWLSFDATGFPLAGGTAATSAKIEPACWTNTSQNVCKVIGWARFTGAPADPEAGGWDGWVSLNTNISPSYGVTYNKSTQQFGGYAWGDWVAGWIDFSRAKATLDDVPPPVDVCLNISGVQTTPPGKTQVISVVVNLPGGVTQTQSWCVPPTLLITCTTPSGQQIAYPTTDPMPSACVGVIPPDPSDPTNPNNPLDPLELCPKIPGNQYVLPALVNGIWYDDPAPKDGNCVPIPAPKMGCTNPAATNYDPAAVIDDGSCKFAGGGTPCTDPALCPTKPIDPIYQEN